MMGLVNRKLNNVTLVDFSVFIILESHTADPNIFL